MRFFHKVKVITVSDHGKKELIQDLLAKNNIEYRMKAKEILQKNPIDTARIGTMGNNKMKITYSFYVEKEKLGEVRQLLSLLQK